MKSNTTNSMVMRTLYVLLITFFYIGAQAQTEGPGIKFETPTHDFGNIQEANGNVTYEFKFTNTGTAPLVLQGVKPSCGCTTPGWSKEPVLPGKSGFIKAEFNPRNRPGAFNKSLTVTANTNPAITRIYIKGIVEPKPRSIADDYPTVMGGIRVKYRSFNFSKITTEKPVAKTFNVYNDSDKAITFLDEIKAPDHIKVNINPKTIEPKTLGAIEVTYDPTVRKQLGFVSDLVVLKTDEAADNVKDFRAIASVEEFFPAMTAEQLAQAPHLKFEESVHDFGTIKQGDEVTTEFVFTNTGQSELNIRQTKASCGCTVSNPAKSTLKPGESSTIKVTFNSRGRRGIQQKSISVFSNDPSNPTQRITIKAKVEAEG